MADAAHTETADAVNAKSGGQRPRSPDFRNTVRDGALEIAFKKFAGDLGADFLDEMRNCP